MTPKRALAFDLSQVSPMRAAGPDGTVWTFPEAQDRNYVETALFQEMAVSNMALMKAVHEGRDDVEDFLLHTSDAAIRLLMALLTNEETGEKPDEETAAGLVRAGFAQRLLTAGQEQEVAAEAPDEETTKTVAEYIEELDLDAFKASRNRPTGEGTDAGTRKGSSGSSGSTKARA